MKKANGNSEKVSGRKKLNCTKCTNAFSTYSTNRTKCYNCAPKCTEKHYFDELITTRKKKEKQDALENK